MSGRMIMEAPAVDVELAVLRRRVDRLEEAVRTLVAANLTLVRAVEAAGMHPTAPGPGIENAP